MPSELPIEKTAGKLETTTRTNQIIKVLREVGMGTTGLTNRTRRMHVIGTLMKTVGASNSDNVALCKFWDGVTLGTGSFPVLMSSPAYADFVFHGIQADYTEVVYGDDELEVQWIQVGGGGGPMNWGLSELVSGSTPTWIYNIWPLEDPGFVGEPLYTGIGVIAEKPDADLLPFTDGTVIGYLINTLGQAEIYGSLACEVLSIATCSSDGGTP